MFFLTLARLCYRLSLHGGFNPAQPRRPAGQPDGGQWTDGTGGTGAPADERPRLVQDREPSRYAVNIHNEEQQGGHTVERHVGQADAELVDRIERETYHGWFNDFVPVRVGSFDSVETATMLINRVLMENRDAVDRVASGEAGFVKLTKRFGFVTGKEAFHSSPEERPYVRKTYGVYVYLVHRSNNPRGYIVRSAYPRNDLPDERKSNGQLDFVPYDLDQVSIERPLRGGASNVWVW